MKHCALLAAICAAACSEVEAPPPDPQHHGLERPQAGTSCEAKATERECARLEDCVWTECPPNADCQLPAWCAARAAQSGCGGGEYALQRRDAEVFITDAYRACQADEDCVLVSTSCNGCCEQGAIASALRATYEENFRSACAGYSGAICDCAFVPAEARCQDQRCTRVLTAR